MTDIKKLTAFNPANDRQIEQMVGKAMCAYANWQERKRNKAELVEQFGKAQVELAITANKSEYEATVRCIDMFVEEWVPIICLYIIDRSREELGV